MKFTLLLATAFLLSLTSFAQRIHFSDNTNQWTYYAYFCPGGTGLSLGETTDTYSGDTVIYSKTYKKILHYPGELYVREDTLARKVYLRGVDDTGDNILYDYTLAVGDSFRVDTSSPARTVYYVASIDSVHISTQWYKTWHFVVATGHDLGVESYTVIEGIGCDVHPLCPLAAPGNGETCYKLSCFHNNGTTPLVSPAVDGYFDNAASCALAAAGVKNTAANSVTANIYPNPIDQTSKIVFSNNISSGSLVIVNDMGQTIINTAFRNKDELLVGDMIHMPGIYFYRVTDNVSGKVFTGKFVY